MDRLPFIKTDSRLSLPGLSSYKTLTGGLKSLTYLNICKWGYDSFIIPNHLQTDAVLLIAAHKRKRALGKKKGLNFERADFSTVSVVSVEESCSCGPFFIIHAVTSIFTLVRRSWTNGWVCLELRLWLLCHPVNLLRKSSVNSLIWKMRIRSSSLLLVTRAPLSLKVH